MPEKEKQKYSITPAEIERRRERALELHSRRDPITGRPLFGGKQAGSGRPRKRRATEVMNEEIEKRAMEYFIKLNELAQSKKEGIALAAIRQIIEISNKETDVQAREDRVAENKTTDELRNLVASKLARLAESGKLPVDFVINEADIIEDRQELDSGESEQQ